VAGTEAGAVFGGGCQSMPVTVELRAAVLVESLSLSLFQLTSQNPSTIH